ncbi:MAG: glycosyltransferase [bacterium]|jgi:glycosyltransferase involved in cell wall biosynthesis|nr:glycosyltransferase [candidate division KSB1 bacterium]MDH7559937.1 glycosyltransferase [bacterium]
MKVGVVWSKISSTDCAPTQQSNEGSGQLNKPLRVAYVLWKFPRFSETFIIHELFFLREAVPGLQATLFAVKRGDAGALHPHVTELATAGAYLPAWCAPRAHWQMARVLFAYPKAVACVVGELAALVGSQGSVRAKLYAAGQAAYCLAKGLYLAGELRRQQAGHVHAHFAESGGLVAFVAARVAGIPYSLTLHGHDIFFNPNPRLAAFLLRHGRFALTVSEFNRRFLVAQEPAAQERLRVLHCGIDLAMFRPRPQPGGGRFRILAVARLQPRKGIADLLEACRLLGGDLDYQCVVVGDGPQRAELETKAAQYGLADRIHFLGARPQQEVVEQLAQASVFVLPSYSEGIPVSVMEAMAMQLPVVATQVNGVPELVREGAGILVEPGDVRALAQALRRVADMSPAERQEMGRTGRAIVEKEFTIRTQVRLLADLFLASLQDRSERIGKRESPR